MTINFFALTGYTRPHTVFNLAFYIMKKETRSNRMLKSFYFQMIETIIIINSWIFMLRRNDISKETLRGFKKNCIHAIFGCDVALLNLCQRVGRKIKKSSKLKYLTSKITTDFIFYQFF